MALQPYWRMNSHITEALILSGVNLNSFFPMVDNGSIGIAIKHCSTLVRLRSGKKRQPISVRLLPPTSEWEKTMCL